MSMYVGNIVASGTLVLSGSSAVQLPAEARSLDMVTCATFDVEGGPIRFWVHGEDPTALEGHPVLEDDSRTIVGGGNVQQLRMIAQDPVGGAVVTWSVGTGAML